MVVKSVVQTVEYTLDDPAGGTPTWTVIPVIKILGAGDRPAAEAQTTETLNGLDVQTAEKISAAYVVGVDDADSFLDSLRDAADNWSPVWFRETNTGGVAPRIIGGTAGGAVTYTRQRGSFGDVGETITIALSATGGFADETIEAVGVEGS